MKAKQYCSFWPSAKCGKLFSKINDSVNPSLQKWIIYHPHVIQYTIVNDYIKVKFVNGNRELKTETRQKFLLQVYVCELHTDMLKETLLGFSWHMMKNNFTVLVILIFNELFLLNDENESNS